MNRFTTNYRHGLLQSEVAFYTVFCGSNGKVANQVQEPPSFDLPCYYFTDNNATFKRAAAKGWTAVLLPGEPSDDDVISNMKAKDIKTRPHRNPRLSQYKYTVFQDSKLSTKHAEVLKILQSVPTSKSVAIRMHNILSPPFSVWQEFELAMTQERYQRQHDQMMAYVQDRLKHGYNETLQVHFWCSFIIRHMRASVVKEIGEKWFQEIVKCGIDDQLSMFFTYQDFAKAFFPLSNSLLPKAQI